MKDTKMLFSGAWTNKRKDWAKRKTAALLCVVMMVQTVLSGGVGTAFGAAGVPSQGEKNVVDLLGNSDPEGAFTYIKAEVGDKVGSGGDTLSLNFYFGVNDSYLESKLEEYLEDGTLVDFYSFEYEEEHAALRQQYGSYDNYIMNREGLEQPTFTCTVNEGILDVKKINEYLTANKNIITDTGDIIGTWEIEETADGPQFRITLNNLIYNRSNILALKGMQLNLLESYDPGTEVEAKPGAGDADLDITIHGQGTPTATDSDYSLIKDSEINKNPDDPSEIVYTVWAKASSSDAETAAFSLATDDRAAYASVSTDTVAESDEDDDEEESEPDSRDMDLIYDLTVPVESHIVRSRAARSGEIISTSSNLVGKYISDTIPDGLDLTKVEIYDYDSQDWVELAITAMGEYDSWTEYLEENGRIFFYQITGEGGEENPDKAYLQEFGVRFTTKLSSDGWREYAEKGYLDKSFPNRAVLKDEDRTKTLTVSNKEEPRLEWNSLLEKEGLPMDVNGKVFQWHINTNAYFSDGVQLYAVDCLWDIENTHNYILDDDGKYPVTITKDGEKKPLNVIKLDAGALAGADHVNFDDLTINDIENILGGNYLDENAYVYEYEYTEPATADSPETTKKAAVMLIPLDDYATGESRITYYTGISTEQKPNYSTSVRNEVKAVWKWEGGPGVGEPPFGSIIIDKEYKIDVKPLAKKGLNYAEATNWITWEFEVNQPGIALDELWIEDALDSKQSTWAGVVADNGPIVLTGYDRKPEQSSGDQPESQPNGADRQVQYIADAVSNPDSYSGRDYYTVTTTDSGATLKIHLQNIRADEYYKFQVQTHVENMSYVITNPTITNKAVYYGTVDNKPFGETEVEAKQEVTNTLITKYVEPFKDAETGAEYLYDHTNNTVQWKVRINAKKLPIQGAVITDELPLGVSFPAGWDNAVIGALQVTDMTGGNWTGTAGTWVPATDTEPGKISFNDDTVIQVAVTENEESGYSKDTVKFSFVDSDGSPALINTPYEITFITQLDSKFLREKVKSNAVTTLINQAKLDGTIGSEKIVTPIVEAKNEAVPKPLTKEGQYFGIGDMYTYRYYDEEDKLREKEVQAAYASWTGYVNRTGVGMKDVKISDVVEECFELVPASLKIEVVTLDAQGNVAETTNPDVIVEYGRPVAEKTELTSFEVSESGFSFTIPVAYKNSVLKLTYDTVLVDDAVATEMTNQITAKGPNWEDGTGDITADGANDFKVADYAHAEGVIFLRVVKSSEKAEALLLKGAEFKLTKMQYNPDKGNRDSLDSWEETAHKKTKTSNGRGVLNFMFLQPNEMYKLEETKPPIGYDRTEKVWYVIIQPEPNAVFPAEGELGGKKEILVEKDQNYINQSIGNMPNTGAQTTNNLKLQKLGQNDQHLAGVKFRLFLDGNRKAEAFTNENGVAEFTGLDPLDKEKYYVIKEVTPKGYEDAKPIHVYVTAERNIQEDETYTDTYTMEVTDEKGNEIVLDESAGSYPIRNTPFLRSGSFQKVDQYGKLVTGFNVTFDVFRRGDGGTGESPDCTVVMVPEGTDKNNYVPYNVQPTVSSDEGVVALTDLYYGYYKLVEKSDEDHIFKTADPIYIRVGKGGIFALPAASETPYTDEEVVAKQDKAYTITLDKPENLKVKNDVKWGFVQINKVVGKYNADGTAVPETVGPDNKNIPIPGVVFAVYHDDEENGAPEASAITHFKTDNKGNFIMYETDENRYQSFDKDGNIIDGSAEFLHVGTYYIKEVKDTSGKYQFDSSYYKFTIPAGTGEGDSYQPKTVWISSATGKQETDGIVAENNYQVTETSEGSTFLNMPIRKPVAFQKVDGDFEGLSLNDAVFHVYAKDGGNGDVVVAELKYDATAQAFVLHAKDSACTECGNDNTLAKDSEGKYYLEKADGTGAYTLLLGEYTVKETTAPVKLDGNGKEHTKPGIYPTLEDAKAEAMLKVSADGAVLSAAAGSQIVKDDKTFKNISKKGFFTLDKEVWQLKDSLKSPNTGEYEEGTLAEFTFRLSATELMHGTVAVPEKGYYFTVKSDAEGLVDFSNFGGVPIGKYVLTETDVPTQYKDNDGTWLVEPMVPVYVEVDADDTDDTAKVTFYASNDYAENSKLQAAPSEISQDTSTVYDASADSKSKLMAHNAVKRVNITGTKLAAFKDNMASGKLLAGAEFTLTHQNIKDKNGDPIKFRCETDDKGTIAFTDVPYGSYVLSETTVPAGYQKTEDLTFTITDGKNGEDGNVANGVYTLNHDKTEGQRDLVDQPKTVNVRLKKVDQNGTAISAESLNARFEVEQTETTVSPEPFVDTNGQPITKREFSIGSGNEAGILDITGLTYGTYIVKEILDESGRDKLADPDTLVNLTLTVGEGKDGTIKVTIKKNSGSKGIRKLFEGVFGGNETDGWHIDELPQGGTADFSVTTANTPLMTNILKYGYVSIQKIRGEQTGRDGEHAYESSEDIIKNVVFKIYEGAYEEGKTPYLTLKTNDEGEFPETDPDGKYTDALDSNVKKALVAGEYVLKEVEVAGSGAYRILSDAIPFTVTGDSMTRFYTQVGTDGTLTATASNVETDLNKSFMNVPNRGTLHFDKIDADTKASLTGAVFGVYSGDELVAFAKYNGAEGKEDYRLLTADEADALVEENGKWVLTKNKEDVSGTIPYLYDRGGIGYLLTGEYTLKELQTPSGDYIILSDESIDSINITADADVAVNSKDTESGSGKVTNGIQKTSAGLTFKKTIAGNAFKPDTTEETFAFVLEGTPSNADTEWKSRTIDNITADDAFSLENIPVGEYALYEVKTSEAYMGFAGGRTKLLDITVAAGNGGTPAVNITKAASLNGIGVEVTTDSTNTSIVTGATITNNWKQGTITGKKFARATTSNADGSIEEVNVPLEGIYFALYAEADSPSPIDVGDNKEYLTLSDKEGEFTFTNVPYGTYWVGEYGTEKGEVPEGYIPNTTRQQVSIKKHGETVEVKHDFVNYRLRGTAVLDKIAAVDKDSNGKLKLSGAEFTVYVNSGTATEPALGTKVAFLTEESGNQGHYVLTNTHINANGDHETLEETVPSGIIGAGLPYLEYDELNNTWYLAYGEYVVVETKTPAGYQPDVREVNPQNLINRTQITDIGLLKMHPLTISGEQNQIWYIGNNGVSNNAQDSLTFTNTRSLADLAITKQIETPTYNGAEQEFAEGNAFSFEISGTVEDPRDAGEGATGVDLITYLTQNDRGDEITPVDSDEGSAEKVIIKTDGTGKATLSNLPAGTYTVREIVEDSDAYRYQPIHDGSAERQVKISFSYNTNTKTFDPSYEWTWTQNGTAVDAPNVAGEASDDTFKNHLKRGKIKGWKVAADNETVGLAGAVFGLYTDEECKEENRVMTATSSDAKDTEGRNGSFLFEDVPYGTYYVKEVKAPSGYVPSTKQYRVEVKEHGSTVTKGEAGTGDGTGETLEEIIFTNGSKRGNVELTKKSDDGSGAPELMQGLAEFTIYTDENCTETEAVAYLKDADLNGVYTLASASDLKQDLNGVRYLQEDSTGSLKLIQGTYWLKETKIPDGYEAEMEGDAQKTYKFTIHSEDDEITQELGTEIIYNSGVAEDKIFYNTLMLGGFTIEKTVEISTDDDLTTAKETKPGVGFVFEIAGADAVAGSLKQIAYIRTLRVNGKTVETEDITADGAIRVTTDADGKVEISGLPIGEYAVTEVDGPDYELYTGTTPRTVKLSQNSGKTQLITEYDGKTADAAAESLTFHNELKRYTIAGHKVDDKGMGLAGAEFGLYLEGETEPFRTTLSTENGRFAFAEVPTGEYTVKEIAAPSAAYLKDETAYHVSVKADMDAAEEILVSAKPIVNVLKRGHIAGKKVTTSSTPLAGATIGLFAENVTEFTETNLYQNMKAVSGDDGSFEFRNIPYGTYKIAELEAPSGYYLNTRTVFLVNITQDGQTVTTGHLAEPGKEMAAEESELVIVNNKRSGGGSGGGNPPRPVTPTQPTNPVGPGVPTEPENPTNPENPTGPENPGTPGQPGLPEIPVTPEGKPDIPPGTIVDIHDPDTPDDPVYHGPYDPDRGFPDVPPGVYELITFDEHDVPLGRLMITIDDEGIPLALPKTGDTGIPIALLAAALIGSSAGVVLLRRRKEEDES